MLERLLTKNTSVTSEPSLGTVVMRLCGLSGFLFMVCFFLCAGLKGKAEHFELYHWMIPLALWLIGTALLFMGAVKAFANSEVRDTSMTVIKISQIATGGYLALCLFFITLGNSGGVWWAVASMVEIFFLAVTITFVLIAAMTRTPLSRSIWFVVILTLVAGFFTLKSFYEAFID
jgi:hypothetical protein